MDAIFGIAALEALVFWSLDQFVGLNPVWITIIEIAVVAAIATLHIESVIRAEVRKLKNPPPDNQNTDETE